VANENLEIAALKSLVIFLLKNLKEVMASSEAVRALLVQRDVFSQDIYDQTLQLALTEWDRSLKEILQQNAAIANDAAMRKWLEEFQGPTQ
jgi:hypothetical protein